MKRMQIGWTPQENQRLLDAVREAKRRHAPLRTAFESVAKETNRRPNSVRNHYYTQLKDSVVSPPSFVPFTEEETEALLRDILCLKAEGFSVRAATQRLACGDTGRMLRLQNKYRSVLKSHPERITAMRQRLAEEGIVVPDPLTRDPNTKYVGRPPKAAKNTAEAIRSLLDALYAELLALSEDNAS